MAPTPKDKLLAEVGPPDLEFSSADVLRMRTPLVYALLRGDEVLYVGLGSRGLGRPLEHGHNKVALIAAGDVLVAWLHPTREAAADAEMRLIRATRPTLNGKGDHPYIINTPRCAICRGPLQPASLCSSCQINRARKIVDKKFLPRMMRLRQREQLLQTESANKVWEFCPGCERRHSKYENVQAEDEQ